jgi:hypothetical protein
MVWQAYAENAEIDSLGHFDIHDRERDRDSSPAVDNLVQKAVAWIVVTVAAAVKAERFKQGRVQRADQVSYVAQSGSSLPGQLTKMIKLVYVGLNVEVRIFLRGDQQHCFGEIHFVVIERNDFSEPLPCLLCRT